MAPPTTAGELKRALTELGVPQSKISQCVERSDPFNQRFGLIRCVQ
jgi:hypothetical protein